MGKAEVDTTRIVSASLGEAATRIGRKRDLAFGSSAALATAAASRVASLLNGPRRRWSPASGEGIMKIIVGATAVLGLALAGCSEGGGENNVAVEERASALQPGEYELAMTVDSIRSTDGTTPASKLKQGGEPVTTRTCVGPNNQIDAAAFVEAGETCTAGETYMSGGRMSLQFQCNRAGKGSLSHVVDGNFKADSFSASVITATIFSGSGDYELRRSVEAKRVGDCTQEG
jgi:hypothetical protein